MNSIAESISGKMLAWAGLALTLLWAFYVAWTRPGRIADVQSLGALIALQVLLFAVARYRNLFLPAVVGAFFWYGMNVPLRNVWAAGRWVVLLIGAVAGLVVWMREKRLHFGAIHWFAACSSIAAITSALVSAFPMTALMKALSLLLLFVFASTGARLTASGREDKFVRALAVSCEIAVYALGLSYGLGYNVLGSMNSLGAIVAALILPVLAWRLLVDPAGRRRYALACTVAISLLAYSRARAGLVAATAGCLLLPLALKRYRMFLRASVLVVLMVTAIGIWSPDILFESAEDVTTTLVYKGHREQDVFRSRRGPWEATMASVREHPWFGGGWGTTDQGGEKESDLPGFSTIYRRTREHGNSYLALLEWVGLLGIVPFLFLLGKVSHNLWKVWCYARRTLDGRNPMIPLAAVVVCSLVNAAFEDWLFAVGYYLTVLFWSLAFCLDDLVQSVGTSGPAPTAVREPAYHFAS